MVPLSVFAVIFCSVGSIAQSASLAGNEVPELPADLGNGSEDPNFQIDVDRNLVVISGAGIEGGKPGSVTVVDYDQDVIAIYDAKTGSCYMTKGEPKFSVRNPAEFQEVANAPASSASSTYRLVGSDGSTSDRTHLPAPLRETCDGLPLKWMGAQPTDTSAGAQGGETLGRRPQRFWRALFRSPAFRGFAREGVNQLADHYNRNY
jgi:hypothetical protein